MLGRRRDEVIVNDAHGAGYTIDFESLDPRAQIYHGHDRPVWLPMLDETCHATLLIGAHAKASSPPATAYHTMSRNIKDWRVNGTSIGEMGLQALIAGHFGVPMVFVSGDEHACREIGELIPGIETAAVKRGLSQLSAVSWAPQKAREMIREGVQRAMDRRDQIEPLRFDPPLRFRDERYSETWTKPSGDPSIKIIDHNTREIQADDVLDLLHKIYGYPRSCRYRSLADTQRSANA